MFIKWQFSNKYVPIENKSEKNNDVNMQKFN